MARYARTPLQSFPPCLPTSFVTTDTRTWPYSQNSIVSSFASPFPPSPAWSPPPPQPSRRPGGAGPAGAALAALLAFLVARGGEPRPADRSDPQAGPHSGGHLSRSRGVLWGSTGDPFRAPKTGGCCRSCGLFQSICLIFKIVTIPT